MEFGKRRDTTETHGLLPAPTCYGLAAGKLVRLAFFSYRVVTLWNNLPNEVVSAPSLIPLNTFKGRLGPPLLFFGSERVWTETASEQPTGHSDGLTSKAEEEGFKVSMFFGL